MSETETKQYSFTVKQYGDGIPFILCEPLSGNLEVLDGGILSFELPKGTDYETAETVAEFLDKNIFSISHTTKPMVL